MAFYAWPQKSYMGMFILVCSEQCVNNDREFLAGHKWVTVFSALDYKEYGLPCVNEVSFLWTNTRSKVYNLTSQLITVQGRWQDLYRRAAQESSKCL